VDQAAVSALRLRPEDSVFTKIDDADVIAEGLCAAIQARAKALTDHIDAFPDHR